MILLGNIQRTLLESARLRKCADERIGADSASCLAACWGSRRILCLIGVWLT